jgi:predicted DNA-binding transcriptional regulator YafY
VRADRLLSLVLLLQARGRMPASALAAELEVSVRTVYRDLTALSSAGVPVMAESGPGGGCELLAGYRFPLRGLRPDEAEALLILGVPHALGDLGLDEALVQAHQQIRATAGTGGEDAALVHLDMPRWFGSQEEVPCLRTMAEAVRQRRQLAITRADQPPRTVGPLGLVNKAGTWYLVALVTGRPVTVFRAASILSARLLITPVARPGGFDLGGFWAQWSAEFEATRPRLAVTVRAAPQALAAFPEIFGSGVPEAAAPDEDGWRVVTLTFEHERAAVHRLAGFGDLVRVLEPPAVRERLLATACEILGCYGS